MNLALTRLNSARAKPKVDIKNPSLRSRIEVSARFVELGEVVPQMVHQHWY